MKQPPNDGGIEATIDRLNNMKGLPLLIKVNRGRNRIDIIEGIIETTYPMVFTVRTDAGALSTLAYAGILSRDILFYRREPNA